VRIREVDFPSAVIEAQRSGRLVLFAGAGVSKDPPADYPDFEGLADQVGGSAHPRRDQESIEVYLGRLVSSGIKVHDQVRQILSSPNSKPNPNHFALIDLFKNQDCFRLVTTNFDRHFATAANERLGAAGPEVYYAPALPVGSAFTGIVNLHGSVDRESHRMVITDSDFARAYINEGWATRFLERLFSQFVVLFIGYSHQDMLMTYLARV
jgi:NAD-dependent SIR2 family protein deacetylase